MNSRTAPWPPGLLRTTVAARRAAGTASDGQAENAGRLEHRDVRLVVADRRHLGRGRSSSRRRTASSRAALSRTPW